jgi:ribonuclease P protein component
VKRQQHLRARADFDRVRLEGAKQTSPYFVVFSLPNSLGYPRIGVTVSKRVSPSAVQRNRARRRITEAFRLAADLPNHDHLFVVRHPVLRTTWPEISEAVRRSVSPRELQP